MFEMMYRYKKIMLSRWEFDKNELLLKKKKNRKANVILFVKLKPSEVR